jgi:hypothetical protein
MKQTVLAAAMIGALFTAPANATTLSHLADRDRNNDMCRTVAPFSGKVVKREFADDETTMQNIVIEDSNGEREVIGVALEMQDFHGLAEFGNVKQALFRMTKVGRTVRGTVRLCGAAGRIEEVDSISN